MELVTTTMVKLSMILCTSILLLLITTVNGNIKVRECQAIAIPLCKSLGYNNTAMPNLVGHDTQAEAETELMTFQPLISYGCSAHLQFFLCAAYAPMCTEKLLATIGPCRPLCEHVKTSCEPVLNDFGFPWPTALNCSKFLERNDDSSMCMLPDAVRPPTSPLTPPYDDDSAADASPNHANGPMTSMSRLCATQRSSHEKFVYSNVSETTQTACKLRCGEHDLFSRQDKTFAETFLAIFSAICLALTAFAVFTFIIDAERPTYPERLVVLVAFCYMTCSVAFVVRLCVGSSAVICEIDRHTNVHVVVSDGLQNPNCVIIFLLLYYFGSASQLWWVILALMCFLVAGMNWKFEDVYKHSSCFHVIAWGIPAAKSVMVLLLRCVDADELTGLCYVGNRNPHHLLAFVIVPFVVYLTLAVALFLAGFVALQRRRRHEHAQCAKVKRIDPILLKICVLSLVFALANTVVVSCYIYEYFNIKHWLSSQHTNTPNMEIFMLKVISILLPGIAAGLFFWNTNTVTSWRSFYRRVCSCHNNSRKSASTPASSARFSQVAYHRTSRSPLATDASNNSYVLNNSFNSYYGRLPPSTATGYNVSAYGNPTRLDIINTRDLT